MPKKNVVKTGKYPNYKSFDIGSNNSPKMGKNILIVESDNDKYFLEALIDTMNLQMDIESSPFCKIDDYECMEGDSIPKLSTALKAVKNRSRKEAISAIGIVIDQDDKEAKTRIKQVNEAIKASFAIDNCISNIGTLTKVEVDEDTQVKIGLYLQNVAGNGNLETVLKRIKKGDSTHADCLNAWRKCIEDGGHSLKETDFDKFWVTIYQRYDQCNKKERKQAGRKCNNEASMKKDIWDFNHEVLKPLKDFLGSL